ncbi:MAG: metallophosphoesterase [Planctomycetes bacterium]|nr:metallophosphoesterase [Planctomycetota bacterium]
MPHHCPTAGLRRGLLLALLLAAATPTAPSQTPAAPPRGVHTPRTGARIPQLPKEEGVFHFAVFGDRTGGPDNGVEVLARAVRETNLLAPDLVMTVGDLINGYNERPQWMKQMEEYRSIMGGLGMPWFPVPGNHDIYWRGSEPPLGHHEADYEQHFGPLWYWFEHKGCGFVVLYSDESAPGTNLKGFGADGWNRIGEPQLAWLESTLEETKRLRHVFVFLHHPRWIEASYPGTNWNVVHELMVRAGNVTAVFAGHIHRMRYEGKRDGIEYLTLASVGASMPFDIPGTGHLHHFNIVTVRDGRIAIATVPVGAVLDPRAFTPEHLKEIDALRAWKALPRGALAFDAQGATQGNFELRFANPTRHPVELEAFVEVWGRGWFTAPESRRRVVEPGAELSWSFACERAGDGFAHFVDAPELVVRASWLGLDRRVDLPEQRVPLALELGELASLPLGTGALRLDGTSGAARVESAALALPDGPFTAEIWFEAEKLAGRTALLAKTEGSELGLYASDGKPSFLVHLGGRYAVVEGAADSVPTGRPVHLAGVYDGSELRLYLDGALVGRTAASGKRKTNDLPLWIGADPKADGAPGSFLRGVVRGVRVSTGARYAGERIAVPASAEPDAECRLALRFDRALGPFAIDRSSRSAHARLHGGARID